MGGVIRELWFSCEEVPKGGGMGDCSDGMREEGGKLKID